MKIHTHSTCSCGCHGDNPGYNLEQFYNILRQCSCFDGIPQHEYEDVLNCLCARRKIFCKGSMIRQISDRNCLTGIVLRGVIMLAFYSESGHQINVNQCREGDIFGEDLICPLSYESSMQVQALTDCEILFLDLSSLFLKEACCPYKMNVATNLLRKFACKTKLLNDKVRILGQKRLRDKIKVYLQMQKTSGENSIELPLRRSEWAEFLCVDRSALSRELGRMQRENILSFQGQHIQILDKTFLESVDI